MMKEAGFAGTIAAGFFSVFLLAWHGYNDGQGDWVFGFLAVFWSLLMMLRLLTLTEPLTLPEASGYLAQKILKNLRIKQERDRQIILETSFGGSFALFLLAGLFFAAWQIYCAAFPSQETLPKGLSLMMAGFVQYLSSGAFLAEQSYGVSRFFNWGQGFLLFLACSMMGFVLRSHAADRKLIRPALLVITAYALTGLIVCASLRAGEDFTVGQAGFSGSGTGSISYLLSTLPSSKSLTLFDILLIESGIVGIALLTFLAFVPLGYMTLSAQQNYTDRLILCCGILCGIILILSIFLPFTPPLVGCMVLCAMGVFLAWGAGETGLHRVTLDKSAPLGI